MNITCNSLRANAEDEQLRAVAGMIYDTDPYIYPAMFASREEAIDIIPLMIRSGDSMFCPENLFVAEAEQHVVGIILWHKGPLIWETDVYHRCGGHSMFIEKVRDGYFSSYQNVPEDTVSLINICVRSDTRGQGIGGQMLDAFFRETPGSSELYVLADNQRAIRLYQTKGFHITKQLEGFSLEVKKPLCYKMERDSWEERE